MTIALGVVLFLLLGAAGYWWFDDEWYGWLTGAGIFALRVGPMFVWKTVLRVLRRQIFKVLLLLLPTSCKQPMRTARFVIRKSCGTLLGGLKRRWQESWMIRIAVLVPAIVALCVIAYDKEGIAEFMTLFAIPFLVTAIFPEGFWSYAIAFTMSYLASHGLEGVIEKLTGLFPRSLLETYREKRFDTLKAMVRHRRAAMEKTSDAFHAWKGRRKHREKTPPP